MNNLRFFKSVFVLFFLVFAAKGYGQGCANYIKYQRAETPYKYNSLSKSATCVTGKTYELVLPLNSGREYKISFYASSIFNKNLHFKIIDTSTGDIVVDLPGKPELPEDPSVLQPIFSVSGEGEYPAFRFFPQSAMKLKVIIDVKKENKDEEDKLGCVGVYIRDKEIKDLGFK